MAGTMDQASSGALYGVNAGKDIYNSWINPFQRSRGAVTSFGQSLMPTRPGQLSPYAEAAYENEKRTIDRNAQDAIGTGIRTLASRGMLGPGSAGALSSIASTAANNAANNKANAYETAMNEVPQEGATGAGMVAQEQALANPLNALSLGVNSAGTAASIGEGKALMPTPLGQIGNFLGSMGSTFGNVAGGIGKLASAGVL